MAEARNIKVKLTVDTSEFIAARDQVKQALDNLPSIKVKAERVEDEDKPDE